MSTFSRKSAVKGQTRQAQARRTNRSRQDYLLLWETMLVRVLKYKEVHGDCAVPRTYKQDPKLGIWVNKQRSNHHSMTEDRRDRLDLIGFKWSVTSVKSWETMITHLIKYKEEHGDCEVPSKYKDDPKLANWVDSQRKIQNSMTGDRRDRLNLIGFKWSATSVESWDIMLVRLVEYKQEHGDCVVPQKYERDPKLGNWVMNKRKQQDSMSQDRKKRLDSIGFVWNPRVIESWNVMLARLVKYEEEQLPS